MYKVTVPGSLMLAGEHSILRGGSSIVAAIDKFITLEFIPLETNKIQLNTLGELFEFDLDNLIDNEKLKFINEIILFYKVKFKTGFKLNIISQINTTVGFGSSAAVTAGFVAILETYFYELNLEKIHKISLEITRKIQEKASGSDLAASIYGGILDYTPNPFVINRLPLIENLNVFYVGYKMKTPEVIKLVDKLESQSPELYNKIFNLIQDSVKEFKEAIENNNYTKLYSIINISQGLMDTLGVVNKDIANLLYEIRIEENNFCSKITGSGLGDCVYTISKTKNSKHSKYIDVDFSSKGLEIEKN